MVVSNECSLRVGEKEKEKEEKKNEASGFWSGHLGAQTSGRPPAGNLAAPDACHLDSGAAWIILMLMFLINSSIGGASRVYGLIYAKQVATGYYDHQAASWPISTASTVENLAAILTPALAQFLSWRQIQLLSTSLFVLANLGAYFSSSLALDILCLGLIQGLALSMSTVLAMAINNDYFQRYRNTAYGLAMCGGTCGILYMGPLISFTLESCENFRSAYLVLALIFTLNYPLSLFIVPRSSRCRERSIPEDAATSSATITKAAASQRAQAKISCFESHFERKESVASIGIDCKLRRHSGLSRCSCDWLQRAGAGRGSWERGQQTALSLKAAEAGGQCSPVQLVAETDLRISKAAMGLKRQAGHARELAGPAKSRPEPTHDPGPPVGQVAEPASPDFSLSWALKLVRCPHLHCVWLMLALYFMVSRIFIIVLTDFAADRGIGAEDSMRLLNFWSLGELCGRLLLCPFVDLQWLSVRSCITLTCGSLGATIGLMVQVNNYHLYAGCLVLVAALASLEYVLINVLIIEYLGQDQVTSCYSIGSLVASPILFMRPTLIGFFRDQLGSYDGLLNLLGAFSLVFALLFGLLEPLARRRWPKKQSTNMDERTISP